MAGWVYGAYAGWHVRRHRVGGGPFRWSERITWGQLTPVGRRWQLRSLAGFAVFVILMLSGLVLWGRR